jgi:hypothetical protein
VAELAPDVYFGGFAQSTAVSGYDLPVYGAVLVLGAAWLAAWLAACELGLGLGVVPAQALKTIANTPMKASGDHLLVRDMR